MRSSGGGLTHMLTRALMDEYTTPFISTRRAKRERGTNNMYRTRMSTSKINIGMLTRTVGVFCLVVSRLLGCKAAGTTTIGRECDGFGVAPNPQWNATKPKEG